MLKRFIQLFFACAIPAIISRLHTCLPTPADVLVGEVRKQMFGHNAALFEHASFGIGSIFFACAAMSYLFTEQSGIVYAPQWVKSLRAVAKQYMSDYLNAFVLAVAATSTVLTTFSWEHDQSLVNGYLQYDQIVADVAGTLVGVIVAMMMYRRARSPFRP